MIAAGLASPRIGQQAEPHPNDLRGPELSEDRHRRLALASADSVVLFEPDGRPMGTRRNRERHPTPFLCIMMFPWHLRLSMTSCKPTTRG
jgi:hypothetical protein